MLVAVSKYYQFSPCSSFQVLPFITGHLKHPERKENGRFERFLCGRVSEYNLLGEVRCFGPIVQAILNDTKFNEKENKFSTVTTSLHVLLENYQ